MDCWETTCLLCHNDIVDELAKLTQEKINQSENYNIYEINLKEKHMIWMSRCVSWRMQLPCVTPYPMALFFTCKDYFLNICQHVKHLWNIIGDGRCPACSLLSMHELWQLFDTGVTSSSGVIYQ